ncbi:MAG: hypothetical protein E6G74_22965 [Alphaproteobacteria bacterium]|nr:MAG: hypothetical protein E6G74_22965 [Alphaproteobacteria bacterium]
MVWLFLSVVLIVVVYLAVQFPAFRKAIWVCLAGLFVLVAVGVGWLYYVKIQEDKRAELSRRLINPDEIVFTDTVLGQSIGGLWRVKGNVTNRSSHELSGFTLKIVVRDCPVPGESFCTTIGEDEVSTYLSVPPSQTRAFEEQVTLRDMPESTKWGWTYIVQEVRGTLK